MLRCEVTHSLPLFWAAGTGFATVEVRRVVVTRIRGCGKGLPQKHLLFCRSKMGVLRQRLSLLRSFCVAVGVVAEFRPAILHFILKQLCCVVKSCLFVNGLTACKLCMALPFGGKGFASILS